MVHVKAHTRHYPKKKKKAPAKVAVKAPKAKKKKHAPQLSAAAKKREYTCPRITSEERRHGGRAG